MRTTIMVLLLGCTLAAQIVFADGSFDKRVRTICKSGEASKEIAVLSFASGHQGCRVDYSSNGSSKTLWEAANNGESFCSKNAAQLAKRLENDGFICDTQSPEVATSITVSAPRSFDSRSQPSGDEPLPCSRVANDLHEAMSWWGGRISEADIWPKFKVCLRNYKICAISITDTAVVNAGDSTGEMPDWKSDQPGFTYFLTRSVSTNHRGLCLSIDANGGKTILWAEQHWLISGNTVTASDTDITYKNADGSPGRLARRTWDVAKNLGAVSE